MVNTYRDDVQINLPDENSDPLLQVRGDMSMADIDSRLARYGNKLRELNGHVQGSGVGYSPALADALTAYRQRLYKANGVNGPDAARERREAEHHAIRQQQEAAHERRLQEAGRQTLEATRDELKRAWLREGGSAQSFNDWWQSTGEQQELARRAVAAVEEKRNMAARPGRDY